MAQFCSMRQAEHKLFRLNDVNNLLNETDEYETKKSRWILKHVLTTLRQSWPETMFMLKVVYDFWKTRAACATKVASDKVRWVKVAPYSFTTAP